jgi:hypothetical protein
MDRQKETFRVKVVAAGFQNFEKPVLEAEMLDYGQVKNNLPATIERLQGVVRQGTRKGLTDTKSKLGEKTFNPVMLGQFKREVYLYQRIAG